ncbi:MAG: FimV/HubP family polar landmark protein [Gammaproteobacteria bacterium]
MSRKMVLLGVLCLVLAPGGAFSLGLGDIRLDSYLNQPLDAEIALSVASRDELDSLQVELASRETFERYGLARPAFLDNLNFRIDRSRPGGAVVEVTSDGPILEPFVTFLLEARWAGGRVLREYTVLLDPPVYVAEEPAAPPVSEPAPVRSAPLPSSEPVPAPAPVRPAAPVASRVGPEYGPVQRNETLWSIAEQVRPDGSVTITQTIMALYRANPGAFDGNVNRLRAGAVLRVPSRQEISSINRAEAAAEFRSQTRAWREAQGTGTTSQAARLELVPPEESAPPAAPASGPSTPSAAATTSPGGAAADAELLAAVQALRTELEETRRLMEVKDAEIAALQARLAELEAGEPAPAGLAEAPVQTLPGETTAEAASGAETAPEAGAAAPEPAEQAEAEPPPPPPAPTVAEPSFLDRVLSFLGSLWFWVILGLVLVAGAALHFARNRGSSSIEDDLAETGTWGTLDTPKAATAASAASLSQTQKLKTLEADEDEILVEERPARVGPVTPSPETGSDSDEYEYPFEDTIAGETGVNLDQSDPLAEADFHMAYGLYDQAADIVKKAIQRDPERYDLRRKLLDICFVWGNSDEFLEQARAVREMGGEEQAADWSKVVIMGKQICPGEPLFEAGESDVGVVDLSLGDAEETPAATAPTDEDWLDFDVGAASEGESSLGDTQEQPALSEEQVPAEETAELDIEDLGIDIDLSETGERSMRDLAEQAPEIPDESGEYIPPPVEDVEPAAEAPEDDDGRTAAERALDEEATWTGEDTETNEPSLTQVLKPADRVVDDTSELPLDESLKLDDLTEGVDVDLGEEAGEEDATQLAPSLGAEPASLGAAGDETEELPPVTMSEVGTKLDLARAYIDMGDPDGARSILEEVLAEGDDTQKGEARDLIETLG